MNKTNDLLAKYRRFSQILYNCRIEHTPGSEFETPILDEMDIVWWAMPQPQRDVLDDEGVWVVFSPAWFGYVVVGD